MMNSGKFSDSHKSYTKSTEEYLEKDYLLNKPITGVSYTSTSKDGEEIRFESCKESNEQINLKSAWLIFISFSCGAAILVLPYTILQLGLLSWVFFVTFILVLLMFCAYLNNESTIYMLEINQHHGPPIRDPYPTIAELAGGRVLRLMTIVVMYMTNLSACISWILLAATVLRDVVPFTTYNYSNQIRIWTVIIVTLLTPLMYLGTYSDLNIPAFLAISSSSISALSIISNSFIAKMMSTNTTVHSDVCQQDADIGHAPRVELLFLAFGSICFSASGASYSIPNMTVLAARPKKLSVSLVASLVFIVVVYMMAGIIPYSVFGESSLPSITTTFYCFMENHDTPTIFKALTILAQVFMTLHFMMVCLLTLNPCYQHIEEIFKIPPHVGWKRISARTLLMIFVLCVCLSLPRFAPVLSIAGGVPFTFVGIIFPILIYIILFRTTNVTKVTLILFLTISMLFVVGNLVSSLLNVFYDDIVQKKT